MRSGRRVAVASVVLALGIGVPVVLLLCGCGSRSGQVFRTPQPPRDARLGDVWVSPKDGAEMVYVPAGEFLMGSTDADIAALVKEHPTWKAEELAGEQPLFRAHLPGYWIDKCEVTVARYRKFCRETGREMRPAPPWGWQDDHPIVNVMWYDASAYAKWAGKRLPTEMEWEKAARGTDGRQYPWGNAWDAGKCANGSNSSTTKPVGSYPAGASPYGALDMAGNVYEWCADWGDREAYRRYAKGDLTPPSSGKGKVRRGGSWVQSIPSLFRCAFRLSYLPDFRSVLNGFRCARDASP
jgi:formylglycine-generating enzyme required for sulfatase activity